MNKMICMVATLVSLTCATNATAQSKRLQEKVKGFFLQSLTTQQKTLENDGREAFVRNHPTDTQLQTPIEGNNVANYQAMVWTAWCEANKGLQEEKLIAPDALQQEKHSAWNLPTCLEPNATMPYYYGRKGASAENGATTKAPLFLYLHGSGPKQTEWANGIKLGQRFQDAPSIYFIPQIPNEGEYYRWWQLAKQYAWEKLIRQALASGEVDANRLYVFGISEGGYGSQRLASFYADYWAAAGPMAGGEPLKNAPVENCANIGFSFLTGADDRGFYRNQLTWYTQVAFDSLQLARPLSTDKQPLFRHRIQLLPEMQHYVPYGLTTPWLKQFVRNPYPKTVLWEDYEMDGRHRSGFYNLQVLERPSEARTFYEMNIDNNRVDINVSNVEYVTTQKDKQWGIEMKFNRNYTPATGGKLRVYLNHELVNLNEPITLTINGKQVFQGMAKPNLQAMVNSCAEYFDPCRIFPVAIDAIY